MAAMDGMRKEVGYRNASASKNIKIEYDKNNKGGKINYAAYIIQDSPLIFALST